MQKNQVTHSSTPTATVTQLFASPYCVAAFILLAISTLALLPKQLFVGWLIVLAVSYAVVFSLTITCLIRQTKDRLQNHPHSSVLGMVSSLVGMTALHACGIGTSACGASLGLNLLSVFLPHTALSFISQYAVPLVLISLLAQLYSLHTLHCFQPKPNCHHLSC